MRKATAAEVLHVTVCVCVSARQGTLVGNMLFSRRMSGRSTLWQRYSETD